MSNNANDSFRRTHFQKTGRFNKYNYVRLFTFIFPIFVISERVLRKL